MLPTLTGSSSPAIQIGIYSSEKFLWEKEPVLSTGPLGFKLSCAAIQGIRATERDRGRQSSSHSVAISTPWQRRKRILPVAWNSINEREVLKHIRAAMHGFLWPGRLQVSQARIKDTCWKGLVVLSVLRNSGAWLIYHSSVGEHMLCMQKSSG